MEGHLPSWAAEVEPVAARARLTDAPRRLLRACLPLPEDFFAGACRRHPVGEIVLPDLPQGDDAGPTSTLLRPPGAALLSQPL